MKLLVFIALSAVWTSGAVTKPPRNSPSSRPAAFASYELRCRGGGLRFSSSPGRSLPTGEQMYNMTMDFAAGTQGASATRPGLNPGQCSWVDRGFRTGEPTQVRFEIVYFGQTAQARHGSAIDRSPTAAEHYPDAQNLPQYLGDSSHYWSFFVYNTNQGYMQATGHKLFKPSTRLDPNAQPQRFPH